MKLILIEDEPDSLNGMKNAVESIAMDITIYISNTAERALEIIEEQRPDLIVTDIMLPGMTGLDLVEQCKKEYYSPKVIVVSGYNDFDYARRSLQIGAMDYLLKPYSTADFIEKIQKTIILIGQQKAMIEQMKQQQTYAEIGNRLMRDNYLVDFCLKPTPLEEHVYQRLQLWELEWLANQSYSLFVMDTKGYPDGKPNGSGFALQTFAIGNIVQELIKEQTPSILFKDPKNRWILLTGIEMVGELTTSIINKVKQFHKAAISLGASSRMHKFENIHAAYEEALTAFRIHSLSAESNVFYESRMDDTGDPSSPAEMASIIIEKEEELIKLRVHRFVRQTISSETSANRQNIVREILNYLTDIIICIREAVNKDFEEIPMSVWESLDECRTLEEYEKIINGYLMKLSAEISSSNVNAVIERAIQIISKQYMEDLSLQIIADELNLHPVWLSQLFKKETGQTYLDFLTGKRMEQAKKLLRETSLKIYEIAESVGYHDLQHFGSVFKKRVGQTPKEFRYGK
ncbi:response regulator [Paenibacillus agaridevorans]|uniref:response regulator n=1 Tax=Paenibacillus agaridevorans TaxID=171404 RepID=UPI001BE3EB0E|nr:response regulator [Paenibacillus agaridevorans]